MKSHNKSEFAKNQDSPPENSPNTESPKTDLHSQLESIEGLVTFLREIDRLKSVERRSWLMDGSRRENSAEHSWHIALMALVLAPYANEPVDIDRVVRMLLIHDLVEIDAGDTFAYDRTSRRAAALREDEAARRLFALLPPKTEADMLALWQEFETQQTPEARFAKAMDRIMPVLHNYFTEGATWREYNISLEQVLDLNRPINEGSTALWAYVRHLLGKAVDAGYLTAATQNSVPNSPQQAETDGRA